MYLLSRRLWVPNGRMALVVSLEGVKTCRPTLTAGVALLHAVCARNVRPWQPCRGRKPGSGQVCGPIGVVFSLHGVCFSCVRNGRPLSSIDPREVGKSLLLDMMLSCMERSTGACGCSLCGGWRSTRGFAHRPGSTVGPGGLLTPLDLTAVFQVTVPSPPTSAFAVIYIYTNRTVISDPTR